jgi:hypothetical protein
VERRKKMADELTHEEAKELVLTHLHFRCRCPECEGVAECFEGCEYADNCPVEYKDMELARQAYVAAMVAFDREM